MGRSCRSRVEAAVVFFGFQVPPSLGYRSIPRSIGFLISFESNRHLLPDRGGFCALIFEAVDDGFDSIASLKAVGNSSGRDVHWIEDIGPILEALSQMTWKEWGLYRQYVIGGGLIRDWLEQVA